MRPDPAAIWPGPWQTVGPDSHGAPRALTICALSRARISATAPAPSRVPV